MLHEICSKIFYLKNFKRITEINKGFSSDKKYIVDELYLVRIFSKHEETRRKIEFTCIQELASYSSYVPKAFEFGCIPDLDSCYMVLEYLPGDDAESVLPQLTDEEQYAAGLLSGSELKKLHKFTAPLEIPSWYEVKKQKSDKYLEKLKGIPVAEDIKSLLEKYIKKNEHLMEGRPNTFLHDDFHPTNLVINKKSFSGIIDFQRMDWGDPLHDLTKLGFFSKRISVPFTRGVVDGYRQGGALTNSFWELYSLYSAMHIVSALVWGMQMGQDQYDVLLKYSLDVLDDHVHFKRQMPKWYSDEYD